MVFYFEGNGRLSVAANTRKRPKQAFKAFRHDNQGLQFHFFQGIVVVHCLHCCPPPPLLCNDLFAVAICAANHFAQCTEQDIQRSRPWVLVRHNPRQGAATGVRQGSQVRLNIRVAPTLTSAPRWTLPPPSRYICFSIFSGLH